MKRRCVILITIVLALGLALFYLSQIPEPDPLAQLPPQVPEVTAENYQLIVVGSDPEGIAAAVAGARNGLTTLLVDDRPVLGGLMTLGWLNTIDMNYDPNKEILNKGIFLEFFNQVEGDSFDVNTAQRVFNRMVENEPNLSLLLEAHDIEPIVNEGEHLPAVTGVSLTDKDGKRREFTAPVVIDATQDADLAAAAGVPYSLALEDMGYQDRYVAVTPVFQLKNVSRLDWLHMGAALLWERLTGEHAGINLVSAWGFREVMNQYQSHNEQVGIRGLNIGRQNDGTLLVNALHVYDINPLDEEELAEAYRLAEAELPHIVRYLREKIPGLKNAQLMALAPELYVRESRHIYGEYRLTVDDVLENKDFPDAVAYGSYPIDIQATAADFRGAVVGAPAQYGIPLRCFVPQGVDGLLVVGRSASFDSLAHGSARVIPVGMAAGEAAATAAALSLETGVGLRQLCHDKQLMDRLRERLRGQGMKIEPFHYPAPETDHWAYEGLKFVRGLGLVFGGYKNQYHLDDEIPEEQFINLLSWVTRLAGPEGIERPHLYVEGKPLALRDISYMIIRYRGQDLPKDQALQLLMEEGFYRQQVLDNIEARGGRISKGAAYMVLKDYAEYMNESEE
ncbi:FAD-dependent oxidoreductase [Desulfofalx alkaliphila]|uniref:FAD-dependent oxidoreductase n=1 Tax=Desulfofalx alkaliphila TaxID=105483 RepID=UPI00068DF941|nr:FAD-dependent oxidoreductase [Desulfofalx alkaliphila]